MPESYCQRENSHIDNTVSSEKFQVIKMLSVLFSIILMHLVQSAMNNSYGTQELCYSILSSVHANGEFMWTMEWRVMDLVQHKMGSIPVRNVGTEDFTQDPATITIKTDQLNQHMENNTNISDYVARRYGITLKGWSIVHNKTFPGVTSPIIVLENGTYRNATLEDIAISTKDSRFQEVIQAPVIRLSNIDMDEDDNLGSAHFVDVCVWVLIGFTGISAIVMGCIACHHMRKNKKETFEQAQKSINVNS